MLSAPARARSGAARLVRAASSTGAGGALVEALERALPRRAGVVPILTYHRVAPAAEDGRHPGLVSATPDVFREQVEQLAARWRFGTLDDLVEARRTGTPPPAGTLVLTFDDAYDDVAEHAWPVLRRLSLPAAMFVPTALVGGREPFWWDELHHALVARRGEVVATGAGRLDLRDSAAISSSSRMLRERAKALPHRSALELVHAVRTDLGVPSAPPAILGWDDLRALKAEGLELAPHSRTHPLLDRLPEEELDEEVAGSRRDLEREVGAAPPVFAYPGGHVSPAAVAAVERAGFQVGLTTRRGIDDLRRARGDRWLVLRRINVGRATTANLLRAELLPGARRVVGLIP